jgi:mRNA interferase RelE/StbE
VKFRYRLSSQAESYVRRLNPRVQTRVFDKLREIRDDPSSNVTSQLLHGRRDGLRRARVGGYRILFYVDDVVHVIDVTEIGPRGDVYKGL